MHSGPPPENADFHGRLRAAIEDPKVLGGLFEFSMHLDRELGPDCVQSALARLLASGPRDVSEDLGPYLRAVVLNEYLQLLRRRRRRPESELGTEIDVPCGGEHGLAALVRSDELARLRVAIAELPSPYRELAELRLLQQLTLLEIATVLGIPAGTVKTRWVRTRILLRQRLDPRSGDEFEGS